MRMRRYPIATALLPLLAACAPGVAEYTKAEAPTQLRVDGATSEVALAFVPGSGRLARGEAARLDRLVAAGAIRPADRVMVAAAGPPGLAAARAADVSNRLLHWGIVAEADPVAGRPRDRAIVTVGRYAVTFPACPNWSMRPTSDFTNAPSSNFGCATAVNLGLMVASPADLAGGRRLGQPTVNRRSLPWTAIWTTKVQLPTLARDQSNWSHPDRSGPRGTSIQAAARENHRAREDGAQPGARGCARGTARPADIGRSTRGDPRFATG